MNMQDGKKIAGWLQAAPATFGLDREISSVGEVTDMRNTVTFRNGCGTNMNDSSRLPVPCIYKFQRSWSGRKAQQAKFPPSQPIASS